MNGTQTTPLGFVPIEDLLFGSTEVIPQNVEDWDRTYDDGGDPTDDRTWVEVFTFVDSSGYRWTLLNSDGTITKVLYNGNEYGDDDYFDFEADWIEDQAEDPACDYRAWQALFLLNPAEWGSEGPRMNYWSECQAIGDDSPLRIAYLPLCVVHVDGTPGLALSGGGQDFSWEIVEAYCVLGHMPPVHYARDLPSMASRGTSAKDRYLIAACERAMDATIQSLTYSRQKLSERFAGES